MRYDFLIVGAGLTGATIARLLHDAGKKVLVIDRRGHLAGNLYDTVQGSLMVHMYGPHYFRTSNKAVWDFVNRFSKWYPFAAVVKTKYAGKTIPWPITKEWVTSVAGEGWEKALPTGTNSPLSLEEQCLQVYPKEIYEALIACYNVKQWGIQPTELLPSLGSRFSLRSEAQGPNLSLKRYQGLPLYGYTDFIRQLLDGGIDLELSTPYNPGIYDADHTIYTGPIDEFFEFKLGRLEYRAQERFCGPLEQKLETVQLNTPTYEDGHSIRTIEWGHLQKDGYVGGGLATREFPYSPDNPNDYEYPVPTEKNQKLYAAYAQAAALQKNVTICGRLGLYSYLDMDVAIEQAMEVTERLI